LNMPGFTREIIHFWLDILLLVLRVLLENVLYFLPLGTFSVRTCQRHQRAEACPVVGHRRRGHWMGYSLIRAKQPAETF
jgi:hypothetical protein